MKDKTYNKLIKFASLFLFSSKKRKEFREKYYKKESRYEINRKLYNIGEHSYINGNIINKKTTVGKYCSIAADVYIGIDNHPVNRISTHPFTYNERGTELYGDIVTPPDKVIAWKSEPCHIGNDVWIGTGVMIMAGVNIGDGAVIGAGAIVTHDIPPYAIAVGVPARVIKYRFSPDIIEKLLELKWWDYPKDFIVNLPFDNIDECIKQLSENKNLRTYTSSGEENHCYD